MDRAVSLRSIDEVIKPSQLRPGLIECLDSLPSEPQNG